MITIIGAGPIAVEYANVLKALNQPFNVVGRSEEKVAEMSKLFPQVEIKAGGHLNQLELIKKSEACIVATPAVTLASVTVDLIQAGLERILVEKPLIMETEQLEALNNALSAQRSKVFIAFNRRNYIAVKTAKKICEEDGGILSAKFDFSEALFRIPDIYGLDTLSRWGLANSTHVIDTVFHFIGAPKTLNAFHYGQDKVEWHKNASIFTGTGVSERDIPFSYHANWISAGKWNIEIMTPKRKLLFSPMETLSQQMLGTFAIANTETDYGLEKSFKPGFYNQCIAFCDKNDDQLLEFEEYKLLVPHYQKILGY